MTRLTPAMAVVAMEEAITLVRALSSGGVPVTFEGQVYRVSGLEPAPVPAPPVWTGTVGPKALAVTGRLADGWVPGRGADWLSAGYRASRPIIDEAAVAGGRDPAEIVTVYNFGGPITDSPQSPAPRRRRPLAGRHRRAVDRRAHQRRRRSRRVRLRLPRSGGDPPRPRARPLGARDRPGRARGSQQLTHSPCAVSRPALR